jgi:hypothetical protein
LDYGIYDPRFGSQKKQISSNKRSEPEVKPTFFLMDTAGLTQEKSKRNLKMINSFHVVSSLRRWRGVTPLRPLYAVIAVPVIPVMLMATRTPSTYERQPSSYDERILWV